MRRIIFWSLITYGLHSFADTMDHFMSIANNIPQMEMKADPQSQAWARSARTVLNLTCDSIVETLILANDTAKTRGNPLFCLPPGTQLNAGILNDIILQTYKDNSSQQSEKDRMTVSQIALMGLSKQYPCSAQGNPGPQNPPNPSSQGYQQAPPFPQAQPYQPPPVQTSQLQTPATSGGLRGIASPPPNMAHVSGETIQ